MRGCCDRKTPYYPELCRHCPTRGQDPRTVLAPHDPWSVESGELLKQNNTGQAEIIPLIRRFRERFSPDPSATLAKRDEQKSGMLGNTLGIRSHHHPLPRRRKFFADAERVGIPIVEPDGPLVTPLPS